MRMYVTLASGSCPLGLHGPVGPTPAGRCRWLLAWSVRSRPCAALGVCTLTLSVFRTSPSSGGGIARCLGRAGIGVQIASATGLLHNLCRFTLTFRSSVPIHKAGMCCPYLGRCCVPICVLGMRRAQEPGWIRATWECCGDTKVLLWDQIPSCAARTKGVLPSCRERGSSRTPRRRVLEGTLDSDEDVADERGSSRAPAEGARGTLAFSWFRQRVCMGKNASPAGGMHCASPLSLGLFLMPRMLNAPS